MKVEECIFFQLSRAGQAAAHFWGRQVAHLEITATQAVVLKQLGESGPVRANELGERLMISGATLTGILDRLEKMAMLERRADPEDRRAIMIDLTSGGHRLVDQIEGLQSKANQEFLKGFSEDEEHFFRRLLQRILLFQAD